MFYGMCHSGCAVLSTVCTKPPPYMETVLKGEFVFVLLKLEFSQPSQQAKHPTE